LLSYCTLALAGSARDIHVAQRGEINLAVLGEYLFTFLH